MYFYVAFIFLFTNLILFISQRRNEAKYYRCGTFTFSIIYLIIIIANMYLTIDVILTKVRIENWDYVFNIALVYSAIINMFIRVNINLQVKALVRLITFFSFVLLVNKVESFIFWRNLFMRCICQIILILDDFDQQS